MASELKFFELPPSALNEAKLESIRGEVIARIPSYDIVKKDYFNCCFTSLIDYAYRTKRESSNFSMSVGKFNPRFNEQLVKERKVWGKANVGVKVRVTGGIGSAFRNRYMATQLGVARVDWQRRSYRLLKFAGVRAVRRSTCLGFGHDGWMAKVTQKLFRNVGVHWVANMKKAQKQRLKDRFHKVPPTRDEIVSELVEIDILDLTKIISTGEIEQLAQLLYKILKTEEEETLRLDEFLLFWHSILHEPIMEALKFCGKVTEYLRTINIRQFIDLFIISMNRKTALRAEQTAVLRDSSQMIEAKRLVSSLNRLPTMQARGALA